MKVILYSFPLFHAMFFASLLHFALVCSIPFLFVLFPSCLLFCSLSLSFPKYLWLCLLCSFHLSLRSFWPPLPQPLSFSFASSCNF